MRARQPDASWIDDGRHLLFLPEDGQDWPHAAAWTADVVDVDAIDRPPRVGFGQSVVRREATRPATRFGVRGRWRKSFSAAVGRSVGRSVGTLDERTDGRTPVVSAIESCVTTASAVGVYVTDGGTLWRYGRRYVRLPT